MSLIPLVIVGLQKSHLVTKRSIVTVPALFFNNDYIPVVQALLKGHDDTVMAENNPRDVLRCESTSGDVASVVQQLQVTLTYKPYLAPTDTICSASRCSFPNLSQLPICQELWATSIVNIQYSINVSCTQAER